MSSARKQAGKLRRLHAKRKRPAAEAKIDKKQEIKAAIAEIKQAPPLPDERKRKAKESYQILAIAAVSCFLWSLKPLQSLHLCYTAESKSSNCNTVNTRLNTLLIAFNFLLGLGVYKYVTFERRGPNMHLSRLDIDRKKIERLAREFNLSPNTSRDVMCQELEDRAQTIENQELLRSIEAIFTEPSRMFPREVIAMIVGYTTIPTSFRNNRYSLHYQPPGGGGGANDNSEGEERKHQARP